MYYLLIIRRFLKHKRAVIERGIVKCTIIKHAVFIFNSRLCYRLIRQNFYPFRSDCFCSKYRLMTLNMLTKPLKQLIINCVLTLLIKCAVS